MDETKSQVFCHLSSANSTGGAGMGLIFEMKKTKNDDEIIHPGGR